MSASLVGMAEMMAAVKDVMVVRAVTGAMRATDRRPAGRPATAQDAAPAASVRPSSQSRPAAIYEARPHLHPTPRIEPRPVQHIQAQLPEVVDPAPAREPVSPLSRPVWAMKATQVAADDRPHKRIMPRWELKANKGVMVDVMF